MFNFFTGRNRPKPEMQNMPTGREREVSAWDNRMKLYDWEQRLIPTLKVHLEWDPEAFCLWASHGNGRIVLDNPDPVPALQDLDYTVDVEYYRNYYEPITDEVLLLTPHFAKENLAMRAVFVTPNGQFHEKDFDNEPLTKGGVCTVRIVAPTGHWARGTAVCSEEDNFDRATGRNLAISRALTKLNEVVGPINES